MGNWLHAMLFGISLKFFKVTLASPSSIQCFTRKMMMFHMHVIAWSAIIIVQLDCQYQVTHPGLPTVAQSNATGDCLAQLGPSWWALVSACLVNLSTSLKVISNMASLLFCSGELLNETTAVCSVPISSWPVLEQIFCLTSGWHWCGSSQTIGDV